jgi:imidazolonepropionase-like amidohydrolase
MIRIHMGVSVKKNNGLVAAALTLTLVASAFAQTRAGDARQASRAATGGVRETLIQNATIMTASHGTIKNASILIRNGKIAEVGPNVKARDANALIIDAAGKFVTPGIIDCHSHTAGEGSINEGTLSVTSMVRIRDIINPYDPDIYRQVAGGLTTVNVLHGSANAIGGQNAVLKLKIGKPVDDWFIADAPPGIKFALGENPKRSNNQGITGVTARRYPATRMGVEETIRDAFIRAKDYMRQWDEYNAKRSSDKNAIAPRRDLMLDALVEILQGKRMIHSHCYRNDEIVMLLNLGDELGFRVQTLQHVLEGYKVADEIAAHKTHASTFADFWGYKMEAYDAIPYNAALMASRGVNVSINSDSDERARRLYLDAAKAMKYGGMSEEEALRTVTLNPAIQLGIDKRTGSIDVGKDADLVIFSQHPFSVYTMPEMTFIEGEIYFDRKIDLEKREELKREKEELIKRERAQRSGEQRGPRREDRPEVPQPRPNDNEPDTEPDR